MDSVIVMIWAYLAAVNEKVNHDRNNACSYFGWDDNQAPSVRFWCVDGDRYVVIRDLHCMPHCHNSFIIRCIFHGATNKSFAAATLWIQIKCIITKWSGTRYWTAIKGVKSLWWCCRWEILWSCPQCSYWAEQCRGDWSRWCHMSGEQPSNLWQAHAFKC